MFITPISFNTTNCKKQINQTTFGLSEKAARQAPPLHIITPNKVDEIIKRPEIFNYAEITVQSQKDDSTWRITGCEGKTPKNAFLVMKKDGEEKIVTTKELCEDYKNWRSLFIRGSLQTHMPREITPKTSTPSDLSSQQRQQVLPAVSEKFKRENRFETVMKTLKPGKNVNRQDFFLYMVSFTPDKYSIRATMNDGSTKNVSKVCLPDKDTDLISENMVIIFKPTPDTPYGSLMTFDEFYENCNSINFWNPNYTIGEKEN